MSVQAALEFFSAVRRRPDVQATITAPGPALTTAHLADLAAELGYACSEDELQSAFRHDWLMRRMRAAHRAEDRGEGWAAGVSNPAPWD